MSENQRALWILSRPDCAEMNDAMQTFTGTNYYSSDQHKEDCKSRQKSIKDTMIFVSFLEERNPFINEENLRNIETGVSATMDVKVDNAKQVGDRILSSMENKSVSEYSFKRKNQTVTLQDKPTSVDIETGQISIDPQLLFQRFIVAADSIYEDKAEIFAYELSSQSSSMFESSGFMRSAQIFNLSRCYLESWRL